MFRSLLFAAAALLILMSPVAAQDSTAKTPFLEITGSADAYWKYDFSKTPNIPTSFGTEQNSISLGMLALGLSKTVGKASFVGEVSFGPRGTYQSLPQAVVTDKEGDSIGFATNTFNIQNLYMSYALTDKLTLTAGYMGTFVGYEVISPTGNFNYSTSYLFSAGPFQNAGIKATYAFSDKVSLMAGIFNDWNVYQDLDGLSDFGAQLGLTPSESFSAYINFLHGPESGTIYDLTTTLSVSDKVTLGLNAADYSASHDAGGYSGAALYLQNAFTDGFALGARAEYFKWKAYNGDGSDNVLGLTLSANLKAGPLTFIPEVRLDNAKSMMFVKSSGEPVRQASQVLLAAVYAF